MVETYLLEYLAAVKKYGTLSSAAEHLHVAQPSLSRSMQKLEKTLGVSLFSRHNNRIEFNETGELAATHAQLVLRKLEEMEADLRSFDRSLRTITVGSCAPGPLTVLTPRLTAASADKTVQTMVVSEEGLVDRLLEGHFNMIVTRVPVDNPELACRHFTEERLLLSVPQAHALAGRESVAFAEIDGMDFLMHAHIGFWDELARTCLPRSRFILQDELSTMMELVAHSDLASFSSSIMAQVFSPGTDRAHVPVSDPEALATFYLVAKNEHCSMVDSLLKPGCQTHG